MNELEQRASEPGGEAVLEFTQVAWYRLLALFRAIHGGVRTASLVLPPYDGSLFDPDSHDWLEGRFTRHDDIHTEALRIDDRTVLHMLRAVQYVEVGTGKGRERRRLSFASLDVEQIGYVYEGLLGFDAFRADDDVVGLTGRPGEEAEVALTDMESHAVAVAAEGGDIRALAARLADQYGTSGIGSAAAIAKKLVPLADDEFTDARRKLLSVADNDAALADRLLPFYKLLRPDLSGEPTVFHKGTMYVTESPLRRFTGTHYTPRDLAERVVEGALEPLVYSPGPLQTADKKLWQLRPSTEILGMKVADIAMGSGAFLVSASRYLADRLIEAWAAEGDERAVRQVTDARRVSDTRRVLSTEADAVVLQARRLIIERCLYGVDINPMAVEMAKLSLWLVSMLPAPFTFVEDKLACGDSLLGITNLEQLEWMHLEPRRGRGLHDNRPWAFNRSARDVATEIFGLREQISWLSDSPEDYAIKRKLLNEIKDKASSASRLANLVVGAALADAARGRKMYNPNMVAANLARIAAEKPDAGWSSVRKQALEWLNIDQIPGSLDRIPLHWPLVFPEVFLEKGGFDAIVGNPPFLGGKKISGPLGPAYREYLVNTIAGNVRGHADLIAYFVLRAHELLNATGQTGLLATNTLAQGDTREVGLDRITSSGVTIRRAIKSAPWPSHSAVLEYCAVWTSRTPLGEDAEYVLDGVKVRAIASSLDPLSRVTMVPHRLFANTGICFIGSYVMGSGFVLNRSKREALIQQDRRNLEVVSLYLNGEDLNTSPDCSATRWVINFRDWPESVAANYPDCFDQVVRLVKPYRLTQKDSYGRRYWWRFLRSRPELQNSIADLDRVIAITLVSKVVMPVMVPTGQVFSHMLGVFATDDTAMLALLSSAPHYWWTINRASTLETRIRYTPSDVFDTFPMPELTQEIRNLGIRLDTYRGELMLERQVGLTKTYNLVSDPRCVDADITDLRKIHKWIDDAVMQAYGWGDLDLDHQFYDTRQGARYTVGPAIRQEILDRLLELNRERYAAEVASGRHDKQARKRDTYEQGELFS